MRLPWKQEHEHTWMLRGYSGSGSGWSLYVCTTCGAREIE